MSQLMKKFCYLVSICILGLSLLGHTSTLEVSVGWTKPPYVIEKKNTGFELELVKSVFKELGYSLNFVYVPFGRSNTLIKSGKVDVALTMNKKMDLSGLVLSEPYIIYQNAAISLKGRALRINNVAELRHHTIVGFQNASIVLGRDYRFAAERSQLYVELPDQRKQVEMLLKGKVDIVVMDINIFNYLSREFMGQSHMPNVDIHRLFPSTPYRMAFIDKNLKDRFNQELKKFKKSAGYQNLLNEYEFLQ